MICPECNAEVEDGKKFCTQCGTKIGDLDAKEENLNELICPNCSKQLDVGTVFCTGCGTKLDDFENEDETTCPNCSEPLPVSTRFCTSCGSDIKQFSDSSRKTQNIPVSDETIDNIKETSKDMINKVEGFFNKATSKKGILGKFSSRLDDAVPKNKDYSEGYLYCRDCGGYYKLEWGESPDDFDSCQCGGELKYVIAIPKGSK